MPTGAARGIVAPRNKIKAARLSSLCNRPPPQLLLQIELK